MRCFVRTCFLISVKLIFFFYPSFAQEKIKSTADLKVRGTEKRWALFHPCAAKKIYRTTKIALDGVRKAMADSLLDNRNSGGTLDAFRHAYWMALASQKVKPKKALSFGKAHERGNYKMFKRMQYEEGELPDSVLGAMDLFNNKIGVEIGSKNKLMHKDSLMQLVIFKIRTGEMKIVAVDCSGNFVNCNFQIVTKQELKHKWINKKCLVPSNTPCFNKE